jgi:two-component system, NtrC family, response regulator AtoC
VLLSGGAVTPEHLPIDRLTSAHLARPRPAAPAPSAAAPAGERERILQVLAECGGNQTQAARLLGVSRTTLSKRLEDLDIPRPRKG